MEMTLAEVPLMPIAVEVFRDQLRLSPCSPYLFPSDENPSGHQRTLKTVWSATLRRAKIPHFRIYDLRPTNATRLRCRRRCRRVQCGSTSG